MATQTVKREAHVRPVGAGQADAARFVFNLQHTFRERSCDNSANTHRTEAWPVRQVVTLISQRSPSRT